MKVAIIQSNLIWENPAANRNLFEEKINAIDENVDLIVLPEMFTTGFTMNPLQVAESMQGETVRWLQYSARSKKAAIIGSMIVKEDGKYYNRLLFVLPSGEITRYDKKHLFTLAGEDKIYTAGTEKIIIEYKGYRICPLICYDLRFPVFSRNLEDYDLLLYVANWPKTRISAWDILLKARSIENMCYTIGLNRIGVDHNQLEYIGHSQVVDFFGTYLVEPQETEGIYYAILDKEKLLETRIKFGFLNDKDTFTFSN